jgi:hypothetical protein
MFNLKSGKKVLLISVEAPRLPAHPTLSTKIQRESHEKRSRLSEQNILVLEHKRWKIL